MRLPCRERRPDSVLTSLEMMKKSLLLVLLAASPLFATAKNPRDREELQAFRLENPCPSDGTVKGTCPGWRVGYIVELCANGQDKRENMRWMTEADRLFVKNANGKHCKKLRMQKLYP